MIKGLFAVVVLFGLIRAECDLENKIGIYSLKTEINLESDKELMPFDLSGFKYFGKNYSKITITTNGVCRLNNDEKIDRTFYSNLNLFEKNTQSFIAPFWSSQIYSSQVSYEYEYEKAKLNLIACDVLSYYPDLMNFEPKSALIITWSSVKKNGKNLYNTFQLVLTTDQVYSFVLFKYGQMTWFGQSLYPKKKEFFISGLTVLESEPKRISTGNTILNSTDGKPFQWVFRVDSSDPIKTTQQINVTESFKSSTIQKITEHDSTLTTTEQISLFSTTHVFESATSTLISNAASTTVPFKTNSIAPIIQTNSSTSTISHYASSTRSMQSDKMAADVRDSLNNHFLHMVTISLAIGIINMIILSVFIFFNIRKLILNKRRKALYKKENLKKELGKERLSLQSLTDSL